MMQWFEFPKLKLRQGGHEVPQDEETIAFLVRAFRSVWTSKYL